MRKKSFVYNVFTNILLQLVVIVYFFVVPKIIIAKFGSSVNGLVTSITQFLAYITLLESGFGPVVKSILYKPIAKKDKNEIQNILKTSETFFRKISFVFIIYIILLIFIYPTLINKEFDFMFSISLIVIISISTFSEYYFGMTYKLYLQAEQKTYVISIIQLITYLLSILSIMIVSRFNVNIQLLKLIGGLMFTLRPLIQNYYIKKHYNLNLNEANSNYEIKQKWDGLAQHIAAVIHSSTDISLITIFCNLAEVSVYSIYSLVVKGIKSIIQAFTSGIDASFGDMIAKGEKKLLNERFNTYEVFYNTINTIIFTSTIILIVPFIKVYTSGVTDANYIRPLFGFLIVVSEYVWAIRLPYSSIVLAAGRFKETKKGAWVECFSNIIISILLIYKFGIVGVTIGTIVAMTIRTVEFIYQTNKYILERNIFSTINKIIVVIIETTLIILICNFIPYLSNINYFNWIINSIITVLISGLLVLSINYVLYRKEFQTGLDVFKDFIKKRKIK